MHVAVVVQNSELVVDIRPRAEAEALAAAGLTVTLVGPTDDPDRLREITSADVGLAVFPRPREASGVGGQLLEQSRLFARSVAALRALARKRQLDVIHAGNPPDDAWLFPRLVAGVRSSRPHFVFDQHDVAPVLLTEKYGSRPAMAGLARAASGFEARSFSHASLVIFANSEYAGRARDLRLLRSPWEVVPNGWSLPEDYPHHDWRRGAAHLLAYVGAISEQDGVDHLVDAVAQLRERDNVRVVVAGEGDARERAERLARALGVGERFEWLGLVRDRGLLASLVRSADVCVAPEADSEFNRLASFIKIGEYLSAARPVVAHRLPQSEALVGGGIEFADDMSAKSLADAIQRLLADPDRATRLGLTGRRQFEEQLSWRNVGAVRLVSSYRRVFEGAGDTGLHGVPADTR
ncbi:MAG: glycosyltransferase [Actinomycetota bacterium]|nr:glycosyltransferase [Actinomycetota bacterium]